jgi:hypothetical protein
MHGKDAQRHHLLERNPRRLSGRPVQDKGSDTAHARGHSPRGSDSLPISQQPSLYIEWRQPTELNGEDFLYSL